MSNNLDRPLEDLNTAWRGLQGSWRALQEQWRDEAARNFAAQYWPHFEEAVPAVMRAMTEISQLIAQAEQRVP